MTAEVRPSSSARGPYRNGLKRRGEIVKAAAVLFGQVGYHGASLRTISTMVGTTPASIVAHFGSKEGLLVAVLENWRSRTSVKPTDESGLDFFRWLILLMRFHTQNRGFLELFLTMSAEATQTDHPASPFILERQLETRERMIDAMTCAIEIGQMAPMEPALLEMEAQLMIGTLDGVELEWLLHPEIDLESIVKYHIDVTLARWTNRPLGEVASETNDWLVRSAGTLDSLFAT